MDYKHTIRFKDLFKVVSKKNTDPNVLLLAATQDRGIIPKSEVGYRTVTISENNYEGLKLVQKGDFCITLRSFQGGIEYSEHNGGISSGYTVLRFKKKAYSKYYKYFLKNINFINTLNKYKVSIRDGQNIPFSDLGKEHILFFEYEKQTAIANYLDYHTTKIDKEISLLEQKVEKIDEYKQALIYESVTKGLDKNIIMKDSEIKWIGTIPAHWEVKRAKDLFDLKKGKNAGTYSKEYILDDINKGQYPVYSGQTENNGVMGIINTFEYNFPKGVLFTTTVGAKAMTVTKLVGKFSLSQNCGLLLNKNMSDIKWNYYMLLTCFEFTKQNIPSYMQPSLRKEDLSNIFCLKIPFSEQQKIAKYLDGQCSKIDKKKELINKKIEFLKEYKQSLIYEAVTGKITIDDVYFPDNNISEQIYSDVESFLSYRQKSFTPSYEIKNKEDLAAVKKELQEKKYGTKN